MNPESVLSAPKAALMSSVIKAIFSNSIDWTTYAIGALIGIVIILIDNRLKNKGSDFRIPVLAVSLGMYLPIDTIAPCLFGAFLYYLVEKKAKQSSKGLSNQEVQKFLASVEQKGSLYAAGMIAGESLMAVVLAIPFAIYQNNSLFKINSIAENEFLTSLLGFSLTFMVFYYIYKQITETKN
jgi:putative OPT family oligopeptide transporter